jgi:hypothetical protein
MAEDSIALSEDDSEWNLYWENFKIHDTDIPTIEDLRDDDLLRILDMVDTHLPGELNYRAYTPNGNFSFGFDEFQLSIKVDILDTLLPVSLRLEHCGPPGHIIEPIWASLRQLAVDEIIKTKGLLTVITTGNIVLELLEAAAAHIRDFRLNPSMQYENPTKGVVQRGVDQDEKKLWKIDDTKDINAILHSENPMDGLDLTSVQGMATHILGKTPAQICDDILPNYRILHCENILRNDLQNKFLQTQQDMREKLMNEHISELRKCVPPEFRRYRGSGSAAKEQLVDYLVKPRITFHGTRRENVPSIVQHGFLKAGDVHPVTKKPLPIWNGSVYGQGIYSSPEAWYALLYAEEGRETKSSQLPGLKLLVCATIMGRSAVLDYDDNWFHRNEPYPGSESHVNASQYAYIVFNSAQILPCYVLHLDWAGKDEDDVWDFVSSFSSKPSVKRKNYDMSNYEFAGDKVRKKQALIAKGQKFFAYGFGSHSGKNIVIEDVAEVSDDEEDYGEYQADRQDAKEKSSNFWDWGTLDGETAHDEYAQARKSKVNRRN